MGPTNSPSSPSAAIEIVDSVKRLGDLTLQSALAFISASASSGAATAVSPSTPVAFTACIPAISTSGVLTLVAHAEHCAKTSSIASDAVAQLPTSLLCLREAEAIVNANSSSSSSTRSSNKSNWTDVCDGADFQSLASLFAETPVWALNLHWSLICRLNSGLASLMPFLPSPGLQLPFPLSDFSAAAADSTHLFVSQGNRYSSGEMCQPLPALSVQDLIGRNSHLLFSCVKSSFNTLVLDHSSRDCTFNVHNNGGYTRAHSVTIDRLRIAHGKLQLHKALAVAQSFDQAKHKVMQISEGDVNHQLLRDGLKALGNKSVALEEDLFIKATLSCCDVATAVHCLSDKWAGHLSSVACSNFGALWASLESIPPQLLRPPRPGGSEPFVAFEVEFKGENVVGESGPYRQMFSSVIAELQGNHGSQLSLPLLFVPVANAIAATGNNQHCFVPLSCGMNLPPFLVSAYFMLGKLLGIAMRTVVYLALDWPSIVWKKLRGGCTGTVLGGSQGALMIGGINCTVGRGCAYAAKGTNKSRFVASVNCSAHDSNHSNGSSVSAILSSDDGSCRINRSDLLAINRPLVQLIRYIEGMQDESEDDRAAFDALIEQQQQPQMSLLSGEREGRPATLFHLSDGSSVDLNSFVAVPRCSGDCSENESIFTFENRHLYAQALEAVSMTEFNSAISAIRRGIVSIVPSTLITLCSWAELQQWVCGQPHVDLSLLRRHTEYPAHLTESSPPINYLWNFLESLDSADRRRFLRFVWAQERLPPTDADFIRPQTRMMVKINGLHTDPDAALPRADTCFFNLELPLYSSEAVLRERLLTAIRCDIDSLDADRLDNDVDAPRMAGGMSGAFEDTVGFGAAWSDDETDF